MKSPFPGMDPFLEDHWLDVHARITVYASDQLQVQMPSGLIVRVEEYMSVEADDEDKERRYSPDVRVHDLQNDRPEPLLENDGGVAVAIEEPLIVPLEMEPATLRSIRILDHQSGNRIVTAIEFLSPANKVSSKGREKYTRKRLDLINARANVVEIDLVRSGGDIVYVESDLLPADYRQPYQICVVRNADPKCAELYRASFKHRLPKFKIPLRVSDKDAVLDLQELIDRAYESGRYGRTIDYRVSPYPPLNHEDAAWADELLRSKKLR